MKIRHSFILDQEEIQIAINLELLNKMGKAVSEKLINEGKYYIQSKVEKENFMIFLDYLMRKINFPSVSIDNYYDFSLLSNEFDNSELIEYLSKPEFEHIRKGSIFSVLKSDNHKDKSKCEQYLTKNLDHYLDQYEEEMSQIPINTLYNVFNNENRILNDHEKAYQFIKKISSNNKEQFCILLNSLDASKLTQRSFFESFSDQDKHFNFCPKMKTSFIITSNEQISEMINSNFEKLLQYFTKQQESLFNKFEEKLNKIDQKYDSFIDTINEIKSTNDDLSNKIEQTNRNLEQLFDKNEEIKTVVDNNSVKIDEIKSTNDNLSNKIEQTNRNLEQLFDKIKETKTVVDNNSININEVQTNSNLFKQELNDMKNKIRRIHENSIIQNPFRGIIHKLTEQCGGNVFDKGKVKLSASEVVDSLDYRQLRCAVELDNKNNYYHSVNVENAFVKYDFKDLKICPTHYSIRTRHDYGKTHQHLKNWVIEGSNTDLDNDWIELDSRKNIEFLDDVNVVHTFDIQNQTTQFYRYIRIRQTGLNSSNTYYYLTYSALEFHGSVENINE